MVSAFPGVRYINARHCKTLRRKSTSILRRCCKIYTKATFQPHKIMQNNGIGPTSRCQSITSFFAREHSPALQIPLRHIASPVNHCTCHSGAPTPPTGTSGAHHLSRLPGIGIIDIIPGIRTDTQKKRPEKFQSLLYWSG